MRYVVYIVLAMIAGLLFLPKTGTSEIRNLPLLILLLSIICLLALIRFFKYVALIAKTKKLLKTKLGKVTKIRILPFASQFHGHYSISFQHKEKNVQLLLLSQKRNYQRYHFDRADRLEFYRANRVVFNSIRIKGAKISNLVEVNRVGKQRIKWDDSAEIRVILFDKLPDQITDSVKREALGVGDRICASNVSILDWASLSKYVIENK